MSHSAMLVYHYFGLSVRENRALFSECQIKLENIA